MSVIKTLDEVVTQRINECHSIVGDKFHLSVRAVFASPDGSCPQLIGSCILVSLRNRKFVVTAAHIIDWSENNALYVSGTTKTKPVQMLGEIHYTDPPKGRKNDKHDTAFWEISDEESEKLGSVEFIELDQVYLNKINPSGRLFMALGYPLSRNKNNVDNVGMTLKTVAWRYSGPVEVSPELSKELGVSGDNHMYLKFNKYSSKLDGEKVSSINPKGISGGALVDVGNFADLNIYSQENQCKGLLAGMIIEKNKRHKVLIATSIGYIKNAIIQRYSL